MKVSRTSVIVQSLRRRLVRTLREQTRDANAPNLAAFSKDIIGNEIFVEGLYERSTLRVLVPILEGLAGKSAARSVCLDIGANIGNHAVVFSSSFQRVYAFEPNPIARHVLHANILMNGCSNVDVLDFGLGAERSIKKQFVPRGNLGGSSFVDRPTTPVHEFELKIRRGDAVVRDAGIQPEAVMFVKIDVEGFEVEVLSGLSETLSQGKPIVGLEVSPSHDSQEPESITALRDLGYSKFYEVSRGFTGSAILTRLAHLIAKGGEMGLHEVSDFTDRKYPLILAVPPAFSTAHSGSNHPD